MCSFLFSILIVGAMESTPGWMSIDYVQRDAVGGEQVETMVMPTDMYLDCYKGWEGPENVEWR